jgi:hypothetical protein
LIGGVSTYRSAAAEAAANLARYLVSFSAIAFSPFIEFDRRSRPHTSIKNG